MFLTAWYFLHFTEDSRSGDYRETVLCWNSEAAQPEYINYSYYFEKTLRTDVGFLLDGWWAISL